jgi:integron integrase
MNAADAIDRMRQVIRRQHKALATEDAYVQWLRRYIRALRQMPQELTSEKKLDLFLTDLARRHDVSASTQNQAFNAILFFYQHVLEQPLGNVKALRATRPVHERHAPTVAQTQALLQTVGNQGPYPTNLIVRMLYGCGLRVSEPLNLRIKDIDLERRRLCIRGAKGGKDRVVTLPLSLIGELTQQVQFARVVWQRDKHNRTPVILPHRLARKYPEYQFSWGWAWLFPAHSTCRDPRSGTIVRYRMHEANVQRAVKTARRKLGISVLPHELRHAYATDCLQRGTNPRAIQQAMGHKSLETTMGYLHSEALSVSSPLDALLIILPARDKVSVSSADRKPAAPEAQGTSRGSGAPGHGAQPTFVPSFNNADGRVMLNRVALSNTGPVPMARATQWSRNPPGTWIKGEARNEPAHLNLKAAVKGKLASTAPGQEDCECFSRGAARRPTRQTIREQTAVALTLLGWQKANVKPPGVWARPPDS